MVPSEPSTPAPDTAFGSFNAVPAEANQLPLRGESADVNSKKKANGHSWGHRLQRGRTDADAALCIVTSSSGLEAPENIILRYSLHVSPDHSKNPEVFGWNAADLKMLTC